MGADYSAFAIIGCIIDLKKIPVITKKVKAFEHNVPEDSDVKFDAKTGRALWEEEEYLEYTFETDYEGERVGPDTKKVDKKGLKLYYGTDGEPVILGFGVGDTYSNGGNDYDFRSLSDTNEIKEKLKSILEPLGMWNEKKFGLYSLLECSY